MYNRQLPAEYVGIADPGDEDTYRHATTPTEYRSAKASVYQFGNRWHWKCGPRDQSSDCLGGPKRTQEEALDAAAEHIRTEHVRELRLHDGANCWCGED